MYIIWEGGMLHVGFCGEMARDMFVARDYTSASSRFSSQTGRRLSATDVHDAQLVMA